MCISQVHSSGDAPPGSANQVLAVEEVVKGVCLDGEQGGDALLPQQRLGGRREPEVVDGQGVRRRLGRLLAVIAVVPVRARRRRRQLLGPLGLRRALPRRLGLRLGRGLALLLLRSRIRGSAVPTLHWTRQRCQELAGLGLLAGRGGGAGGRPRLGLLGLDGRRGGRHGAAGLGVRGPGGGAGAGGGAGRGVVGGRGGGAAGEARPGRDGARAVTCGRGGGATAHRGGEPHVRAPGPVRGRPQGFE